MEVTGGVLEDVARELNHPFLETRSDDEPHVTLKLALTADGALARSTDRRSDPADRAVTGSRVQRRVHRMRAGAGAVVVGAATARADHPRLDVRRIGLEGWSGRPPVPVVLQGNRALRSEEIPPGALLLRSVASPEPPDSVECATVPARSDGRLDWEAVFSALVERGRGIVLVEGGATIAADLLAARPPQRIHLYLAGRGFGPAAVKLPGGVRLDRDYGTLRVRRIGPDVEWVLRRRGLD
jgi:diaminohydroxyphosphoribosylaminopyrimidine deaminase/5-amino-6-(5-phosphoribosylamino)uracil reductase